ncbi:hypothetical protein GGF43_003032 [Coemansia sp. RSA 2618]|nr:hypothetical protein GGF43_003032 [Coemansia sp. RSA 2618]
MYTEYFADMPKPQFTLYSNVSSSSSLFQGDYSHAPASPTTPDHLAFAHNGLPRSSSRINLEGSWLSLESDDEDDYPRRNPLRMRRKNSAASAKGAAEAAARSPLANIRELKHRSTLRIRRLTDKLAH